MKKLIAGESRKDIDRARKRMTGCRIAVGLPGVMAGEFLASEVLTRGFQLLSQAQPRPALSLADLLLAHVDDVVDVYLLRARALLDLEAVGLLDDLVAQLLRAAPANQGVVMVAARYYYLLGDAERSMAMAKRLLAIDSNHVEALLHIELCYRYSGDTARAEKILHRCLKLSKNKSQKDPESFKQYSAALLRLANYSTLDEVASQDLASMSAQTADPILQSQATYALAAQSARQGEQRREEAHLLAAKQIEQSLWQLNQSRDTIPARYDQAMQRQREVFSQWRLPKPLVDVPTNSVGDGVESQLPVFILGLPRSGTTLMEQILGGHSQVGQVGESKGFLLALERVIATHDKAWLLSNYPQGLDRLAPEVFVEIRAFFEQHQGIFTKQPVYIDKELSNFKYVGLMAELLPQARFIHMDRAPMDIFLSCFRNSIPGVPETADLTIMAEYYVYMKRLMGLWRERLGERLLIINYQQLVAQPEQFAREAVSFLGLEYEPAMLDFHQRKNIVRTLSVDQVRKKIYTSSVEKWRTYAEVLEPAQAVLQAHDIPLDGVPYL